MNRPTKQRGQTAVEYVVVCVALAMALGVGMADDGSVLMQLLQAFKTAYQRISYALAIAL